MALAITGRRETLRALVPLPWAAHERPAHRAGTAERETREGLLRFVLLRVVERGKKFLRCRLHGLELLLPLLAHLAHERKAVLRAHLADRIRIDALTSGLHRGCRVLKCLGVFDPGGLLGTVPTYLIENVRPQAVRYQGKKLTRARAPFESYLATLTRVKVQRWHPEGVPAAAYHTVTTSHLFTEILQCTITGPTAVVLSVGAFL